MCAQPGVSVLQTSLVLPLTALALSGYLQKSLVFNLDQGCLHCRLASVLPSAVSSYSRGAGAVGGAWYVNTVKCLSKTVSFLTGVSVPQTSLCAPLDCLFTLSGSLQTSSVLNQDLLMQQTRPGAPPKPGLGDQGCLYCRLALALPLHSL